MHIITNKIKLLCGWASWVIVGYRWLSRCAAATDTIPRKLWHLINWHSVIVRHLHTSAHTHMKYVPRLSTRPCVFGVLLPFSHALHATIVLQVQPKKNNETKYKMPKKNEVKSDAAQAANPLTIMHTESSCFPLLILIRGCTRTPYSVLSSRDWSSRGAPQRLKRFASHFFTSLIAY